MRTIFVATSNTHKTAEIAATLGLDYSVLTQRDANVKLDVEETGGTFRENAFLKAATWAAYLSTDECHMGANWVMADDSGLEVDALDGAPGVHSARFAALDDGRRGNSPDAENNAKLLRLLGELPLEKRTARFHCVLAFTPVRRGQGHEALAAVTRFFEGTCEGRIGFSPRGNGGFGYDPLFIPGQGPESFAELGEEIKNRISHRAKALASLKSALKV
jgi:XTP/dITP diphosphohydrolase